VRSLAQHQDLHLGAVKSRLKLLYDVVRQGPSRLPAAMKASSR
jgi:hypothetical protein